MMTPRELEFGQEAPSAAAGRFQWPGDPTTNARFPTCKNLRFCSMRGISVQAAARRQGRLSFESHASADRSGVPADAPSAVSQAGGAQNESAAPSMVADDALRIAKCKLTRHLQRNKLSMSTGLVLGAAALAAGLYSSPSFYRWAFLLAAAWELGILPLLCAGENRRLRRVLSLVQQELGDGVAAAAPGEA